MTAREENPPEKKSGCGLLNAVFGRGTSWLRRTPSTSSLPRVPISPNSKRRRAGVSDESAFLESSRNSLELQRAPDKIISRPSPNHARPMAVQSSAPTSTRMSPVQNYNNGGQNRRVPREAIGISGELESMINDHQRSKGSGSLVRASSGNVMLMGNLGNLRGAKTNDNSTHAYPVFDNNSYNTKGNNGNYTSNVTQNVARKTNNETQTKTSSSSSTSLCRAISTRMDPETLKIMGNEDYKNGRFAEALALYDAAISIDPSKASYRSNRSAALTALGKILEAVFECREAIRIEPHYHRAHYRLASLYIRLGEAEKAIYHYKHAGPEADPEDKLKAQTLQAHLTKLTEAKKLRDWKSLINETERAISAGADSAPQIYALQAETYLRLHRHQDAVTALANGPSFEIDDCTKFFGPIGNSNLLMVRAQVDMAAGRFDDALAAAQRAARLDSDSKEVSMVVKKARAVAQARSNGNQLFKSSRFSEACVAYGEGLDHDPFNSVLLCNRAACLSKLSQFEKAIQDCNEALNLRPNYSKARLRRADCNTKLEKWEASIQDYEILEKETPGDEEVARALSDIRFQHKQQQR